MSQLLILSSTDARRNLALEELIAQEATELTYMLWRNGPSIIVGRHQNTSAEIDDEYVRARGIQVVRRITGGGAVYHDLGNLNFSCIIQETGWSEESAKTYSAPILEALGNLGITAEVSGRNDILANGVKVSGCARSVTRGRTLFHGTLLFDTDLSVLSQALRPDPEKILSKGIKSVRSRVGNLREMLPGGSSLGMDEFIEAIGTSIQHQLGISRVSAVPEVLRESAELLAEEKYCTWAWNYGTVLTYDMEKRLRCAGGVVVSHVNIRDNRIAELAFTGDFFGELPIMDLTEKLVGQVPQYETLKQLLCGVSVEKYIWGITAEQLAVLLAVD